MLPNPLPSAEGIASIPVISTGPVANLHYDDGQHRIWLSRCGLADGEPFERTVYVEIYDENGGRWCDLGHYDGENPPVRLF